MKLKWLRLNDRAVIPFYAHDGDAGFDLRTQERKRLWPGETYVFKTGLACEIPEGYEMQIRGRSGISAKTPLIVKTGTVDSGYRGEIGIIVINAGSEAFLVDEGERIAQGVVSPVARVDHEEVDELSLSSRGTGGLGSTGRY